VPPHLHLPSFPTRRSSDLSSFVYMIIERYCVPTSGPCRFTCVGSCATVKKILSNCSSDTCEGSNVTLTDSAWPVDPELTCSYDRSEEHTSELQSLAYLVCR